MFSSSTNELMARLVAMGVPSESVGDVIRLTLRLSAAGKLEVVDPPSAQSAIRAAIQIGCAIEYEIAQVLHRSEDLLVCFNDPNDH